MAQDLNTFIRLYGRVKADWEKGAGKHWWIVPLDLALEKICRESPSHTDPAQVYAKVRLINRAYLAKLELIRKVEWPEWEVAKAFAKAADSIMRPLRSLRALDHGTVTQVVECHAELMDCVRRVTRIWPVSFCSKYLHFHFPGAAPIYDSVSAKRAKKLAPPPDGRNCEAQVLEYEYGKHCLRILWLLGELQRVGVRRPELSVVDFVLYSALADGTSV